MHTPPRPLIIDGPKGAIVHADGPALRIDVFDRASTRFPLRTLSRVISAQGVEWKDLAIRACLSVGIPILFRDEQGNCLGYMLHSQRERHDLYERLSTLVTRTDGSQHYQDWKDAALRRAHLKFVHLIDHHLQDLRPATVIKAFENLWIQCGGTENELATLRTLVTGIAVSWIADHSIPEEVEGIDARYPFLFDISELLFWHLMVFWRFERPRWANGQQLASWLWKHDENLKNQAYELVWLLICAMEGW